MVIAGNNVCLYAIVLIYCFICCLLGGEGGKVGINGINVQIFILGIMHF